jgi:mRNA interferase YafQ
MLKITFTKLFRKQRNLMQKRGRDMDELTEVMFLLVNELPLLPKHENHPLHGNWKGCQECHVEPNWLLIYEIDKSEQKIIFHRTRTHSDLF